MKEIYIYIFKDVVFTLFYIFVHDMQLVMAIELQSSHIYSEVLFIVP